ncbi:pirin family protein [Ectothiorhodospiraceae bacterium 2226]|nr:pirin family protein [Ectothiorhodospiraceae bacterium 2226]
MRERKVQRLLRGRAASDGDGVRLSRVFGPGQGLDPFLLLDEFGSDEAADYIGGFPAHPHRGFETVTYMLEGEMLHEDHLGNRGRLTSGSVQWMTAGRGIIHSEMPQQEEGRMRGFQLWLNLPAREKMKPAGYRDIPPQEIPEVELPGARIKLIAGTLAHEGHTYAGAVTGITTQPLYLDVHLAAGAQLAVPVSAGHTAMVYVYEGEVQVAGERVGSGHLAALEDGEQVTLASTAPARALVLAAKPLREPVAHYGPFVMNTSQEVEQAMRDYRDGRLTG